jgi:hypothetical protein
MKNFKVTKNGKEIANGLNHHQALLKLAQVANDYAMQTGYYQTTELLDIIDPDSKRTIFEMGDDFFSIDGKKFEIEEENNTYDIDNLPTYQREILLDFLYADQFGDKVKEFLLPSLVDSITKKDPRIFDIVILENLYRQLGLPCPWNFWQIRDSRTLLSTHGDPRDKNKAGLHNALEDCVSQAQAVQIVFEQCGITEKR